MSPHANTDNKYNSPIVSIKRTVQLRNPWHCKILSTHNLFKSSCDLGWTQGRQQPEWSILSNQGAGLLEPMRAYFRDSRRSKGRSRQAGGRWGDVTTHWDAQLWMLTPGARTYPPWTGVFTTRWTPSAVLQEAAPGQRLMPCSLCLHSASSINNCGTVTLILLTQGHLHKHLWRKSRTRLWGAPC